MKNRQTDISSPRIPRATYRLQFHRGFTLRQAIELVPYLHNLGISHLYASPLLKAVPGSTHGYDVCDFTRISPEVGTELALEDLATTLRGHDMGLVLDFVPNHMGIGRENPWWWDVLKNGRSSRFAGHFDIDWDPPDPALKDKVLAPVLGDEYEQVLARGELKLELSGNDVVLRYFEHCFPITPASLGSSAKPPPTAAAELNADVAALDALIQQQHYRLAFWRHGDALLNYRRFFNIVTLAGIRVEDSRVFEAVHARVFDWQARGLWDGIRIDHPDGLRDPLQYLQRLRAAAPHAWIVVEKILEPREELPQNWPVAGTTGYDFLNQVNGIFVDPASGKPLTDFYAKFTGEPTDFPSVAHKKKRRALQKLLAAEMNRLVLLLGQIAALQKRHFTGEQLREALVEVIACLPVYRTYAHAEEAGSSEGLRISPADVRCVEMAIAAARHEKPGLDAALLEFIGDLLQLRLRGEAEGDFVMRLQQLTGSAMAKGVEDTTFYCFNRFVALNEVGGDPGHFGSSVEQFHEVCEAAHKHWPHTMLATSTHDTKRSEDVRARLDLLSEIPDQWISAVRHWSAVNEKHRREGLPDRNAEYHFYQMLVGAWPLPADRALAYMEKASREAKQHTSWSEPNAAYDTALKYFVTATLSDPQFTAGVSNFVTALNVPGQINSLAQTLLKLTAPGVPDFYQGNELWDFSLVDPDNRRTVDFALRQRLAAEAKDLSAEAAWQRRDEGLPKLWLIQRTLRLRARRPDWFEGNYEPRFALGARANHVIAFSRGGGIMAIVPRFPLKLKGDWLDTTLELPRGNWRNEFTGEDFSGKTPVARLLMQFPVALLAGKEKD
jgi:(1->4)-alpha-D-glucan 1-alpha-D-glucosylmutase